MTKIHYTPQLDYNNVLIRPKRSTLSSRSEVSLEREIKFRCGKSWTGVPFISANMDTTGTFELYKVLSRYKIVTAMNKFYAMEDYLNFHEQYSMVTNTSICVNKTYIHIFSCFFFFKFL